MKSTLYSHHQHNSDNQPLAGTRRFMAILTSLLLTIGAAHAQQPFGQKNGESKMSDQTTPKKIVTKKTTISTNFGFISQVAWSPDSRYFAISQHTPPVASVVVYDAKTQQIVKELPVKKSGPYVGANNFVPGGGPIHPS